MTAESSLRDGNLQEALTQLQGEIRSDPANSGYRVFLFQLLSVLGDWERALSQLNVAAELDPSALMMARTYREALGCEALRADVFAGGRTPLVFGDPEQWVAFLLEALRLGGAERHEDAAEMRRQAFEAAPATSGTINGEPFEWVADADVRLGPVMETILNGNYYWIPFACIQTVVIEAPSDLRDLVWMPAEFHWTNGGEAVGLIPTRYPGSEAADASEIRLARRTEWIAGPEDQYSGLGQRTLATDRDEYPLMEIREIRFEPSNNSTSDDDGDNSAS